MNGVWTMFVYVLIEYLDELQRGIYEVRGATDTLAKAVNWQLSSPHRSYDKWRVR